MSSGNYNYSVFAAGSESFEDFASEAPQVTMRAPSFALEDLTTGETIEMKSLWARGIAIIEFGSFT